MSLSLFKFYLFSSQDFDFFKTPAFLGSEFLIMLALPYEAARNDQVEACFMSTLEIAPRERTHGISKEVLTQLAGDLESQLPEGAQCKAIFDLRQLPSEWTLHHMTSLPLRESSAPDAILAHKKTENFLLLKLSERKMLAHSIPWNQEKAQDHRIALSKKSLRKFYDLENSEISTIVADLDRKKKLLLHVCCGPDAAGVVEQLKDEFELTCFWYDPNIQPKEEYDLRLNAFLKVTEILKVDAIVGEYDVSNFLNKISGLEASPEQGAKCTICYDMRLERSALEAKKLNCDLFSTTLAISPHKVQLKLKQLGENLAKKYEVPYLARNFMKEDGFKDSVEFTLEHNIYRQDYCGCWFSLHEGGPEARKSAETLGLSLENIKNHNYKLPQIKEDSCSS